MVGHVRFELTGPPSRLQRHETPGASSAFRIKTLPVKMSSQGVSPLCRMFCFLGPYGAPGIDRLRHLVLKIARGLEGSHFTTVDGDISAEESASPQSCGARWQRLILCAGCFGPV